jgi:hypothetical protein
VPEALVQQCGYADNSKDQLTVGQRYFEKRAYVSRLISALDGEPTAVVLDEWVCVLTSQETR